MLEPNANAPVARRPWTWIPTLYLAEGIPYVVVMTVSVIAYKGLGLSNAQIAFYTSWLYLPWVIKPLWSPVVDLLKTRRQWIWFLQLVVGAAFAGVALSLQAPQFLRYSLAFLWLLAFSSATHDIAADGFYMLATTEREQAFFVGIRNTFYRIAMITGQGLLVILAGFIQSHTGLPGVDVDVAARPGAPLVQALETNWFVSPAPARRELFVVVRSSQIEISPVPRRRSEIDDLIRTTKAWNVEHGFYIAEQTSTGKVNTAGGWSRAIAERLGNWIRIHFGTARRDLDRAGNLGVLAFQLSQAPGREIVVSTVLKAGDKSLSVAEGARLSVNDRNWNQPAFVVFQLDPRLTTPALAHFELRSGNIPLSWSVAFLLLTGMFISFGLYHKFVLPRPAADRAGEMHSMRRFLGEFFRTFGIYFRKPKIIGLLLFLLFYRFAEAQLVKLAPPFLLDAREAGGLGLTTGQVGLVYGTIGVIALMCGGLLGGVVASRRGLKFWLWPMVLAIHLPDAVFVYLAAAQPDSLVLVSACVALEQFGYGFGFTAYMLYMIYIARGEHQTAHYAICTGFMALGMMLPGMWSGWLQEIIGYRQFFIWVMLATIPGFIVTALIPLDAEFGRKNGAT